MVSRALLVAMAILVAAIAAPAMAKDVIVVGDDNGWKMNFDYKKWAAGKSFYVGDSLVFNYVQGTHNVLLVNQTEYENCDIPLTSEIYSTGNDVINLNQAGKIWYTCGVSEHCTNGMKLAIEVMDRTVQFISTSSPGPSGTESAAIAISPSMFFSLMIGAALAYFIIMLA